MIHGVFKRIISRLNQREESRVAIPVILRHITCPYCSSIYGALTLGKVAKRIDKSMFMYNGGKREANPRFRETHLANPIKCPDCGREFIVFVGVEYDYRFGEVRDIDVKIALPDDPIIKALSEWPHRGLVMRNVLEYTPYTVRVYESMEHFEQYNGEASDIAAASLENIVSSPQRPNDIRGDSNEPRIIDLTKKP